MSYEQITPPEGYRRMQDEGAVYIDVRTREEWDAGHAKGAVHVPMHVRGPSGLVPVPDFPEQVTRRFPKDARLVLGCASGGRSAQACEMLADLGFAHLANLLGGFCGRKNPATGETVTKGWQEAGLPTE